MNRLLSLCFAGLVLIAPATPPALAQDAAQRTQIDPTAEPPRCVRLRNINGYSVIDDQHLVLTGGASRHYLVTTRRDCFGLRPGYRIATTFSRNQRVCRPVLDYVIGDDGIRCLIDQVEEVDDLDAARVLVEARAALEDTAENSDR